MVEFFIICCILFGCAATVSFFRGLIVFFIGFVVIAGTLGALAGVTRVQTHKIHHTIAATRQTEARKFLASLS